MKLSLSQIAEMMDARGTFPGDAVAHGYSIDSRTVAPGQLFFAIHGDRFDGHDFVEAALSTGAVAAVVAADRVASFKPGLPLLAVADTLTALQQLAREVRLRWGKPLVGVTGSAGKTTTKELVARVLGVKHRALKSEGNLNNHFGLPLQLLKLEPEHDIAVIEMGMSHAGEIARLADIARPTVGVVTMVAPVHIEFFDSIAGIAKAKKELVDALPDDGIAVLNVDDEHVSQFGANFPGRIVTFGVNAPADIRAANVVQQGAAGIEFDVVERDQTTHFHLPLIGSHNVYNALAAITAGAVFGVTRAEAAAALQQAVATDKRGQVLEIDGATVVNDCYNSNPKALQSMIDALAAMPVSGRRIVVAGEMLELGDKAPDLHRRCGAHAAERGIDVVVGVRGAARHIVEGARNGHHTRAEFIDSPQQAGEWLAANVRPGDAVLLKASRGVRLEFALDSWRQRAQATITNEGRD